jgi:ectoine hydroxylase-related dioxygenase (phytanoyl-CoA dioxygenase family)
MLESAAMRKPRRSEDAMPDLVQALMARRPDVSFQARLTADDKAEFAERGFIKVDRITSDEEVAWLQEVYDGLFDGEAGAYVVRDVMTRIDQQRGDRIGQIIRPENYLPELKETQFWKNSRRLAAELLALPEGELNGWGHMVRKAPRDDEALPFHQDEGFWDPNFDYQALGVWMPLDPATVESGCMSLVPGSHKLGIQPHQLGQGDPAVTYIELVDQAGAAARAVPHPIPIGGASFHHCRTIHGSGPNTSDHPRRAYINEWQAEPAKRERPKDHPWFWPRYEEMMKHAAERMKPAVAPA